jgi:hypothetical protein
MNASIISRFLFISLFLIYFISCSDEEIVYPEGGYPYLKPLSQKDSNNWILPIRHLIPKHDSFQGIDIKYFYRGFNEENLSLKPLNEDIFRFVFECGFCGKAAIVKLTPKEIIIKKNKSGLPGSSIDSDLLAPREKEHYEMIELYYPFNESKYSLYNKKYISFYKKYFDSILKIYPQLLDQEYFEKLRSKATVIHTIPLEYSIEKIPLTAKKFKYFVDLINKSEFWHIVYVTECVGSYMDGDGFLVEANTRDKYNLVISDFCQDGPTKLKGVIKELLGFINFNLDTFYRDNFPAPNRIN